MIYCDPGTTADVTSVPKFVCCSPSSSTFAKKEYPERFAIIPFKCMGATVPAKLQNEEGEVIFEPGTKFRKIGRAYVELPPHQQDGLIFPPYYFFDRKRAEVSPIDVERAIRHSCHIPPDKDLEKGIKKIENFAEKQEDEKEKEHFQRIAKEAKEALKKLEAR